jgi:hypothetical protein
VQLKTSKRWFPRIAQKVFTKDSNSLLVPLFEFEFEFEPAHSLELVPSLATQEPTFIGFTGRYIGTNIRERKDTATIRKILEMVAATNYRIRQQFRADNSNNEFVSGKKRSRMAFTLQTILNNAAFKPPRLLADFVTSRSSASSSSSGRRIRITTTF